MIDPNRVITIDREVGTRICWLLTLLSKITRRKIVKPLKIKKILFIKLSEMGSTVLAYPAIRAAQRYFPDAKIYFLTFRGNEEMIEILDTVPGKNILSIDIFSLPKLFIDIFRVLRQLRKEKIDAVIDFELFSRISAILGFLVKAPFQVGFHPYYMEGLQRGEFFTHKILYNHYLHTSLAFLSLVESLRHDPATEIPLVKTNLDLANLKLPQVKSSQAEKKNLWQKIQEIQSKIHPGLKLVVFNAQGGEFLPLRRWPAKNFIQLGQQLLRDPQIAIVLAGTKNGQNYDQAIADQINHPRCANLAGQTTINELLTLFNISHLLITNDSGPAHFAALTQIPTITLFGPETPLLYAPLNPRNISLTANLACSPCINAYNARRSPCNENLCMQKIKVTQVLSQALSVFGQQLKVQDHPKAVLGVKSHLKTFRQKRLPVDEEGKHND